MIKCRYTTYYTSQNILLSVAILLFVRSYIGAEELGYPDTVHGLFRDPGAELALHFYSASNDSLSQMLRDGALACPREERLVYYGGPAVGLLFSDLTVFDYSKAELAAFLSNAIKTRLLMLQPYLNQWPQAIALLSKPSNAPHALSNLMTLVNDVCYYAGDRSIEVCIIILY